MRRQLPIFLQILLLASLAVRLAVGAPCCLSMNEGAKAAESAPALHHEGAMHDMDMAGSDAPSGHDDHEGDNTANPCCSACGPTLAAQSFAVPGRLAVAHVFIAVPEHPVPSLEAIRAYQARGPPSRV